jgi:hypothetical protein
MLIQTILAWKSPESIPEPMIKNLIFKSTPKSAFSMFTS